MLRPLTTSSMGSGLSILDAQALNSLMAGICRSCWYYDLLVTLMCPDKAPLNRK